MSGSTHYLALQPRDPLIFRDARPFGFGQRMKSLPWLTPSVAAGSVRSMLGKAVSPTLQFSTELRSQLLEASLSAALPSHGGQLFLPAPADVVAVAQEGGGLDILRLQVQALAQGEGILGLDGLHPGTHVMAGPSGKTVPLPAWWRVDHVAAWLCGTLDTGLLCDAPSVANGFWAGPTEDARTHVGLGASGVAEDGMLFQTLGMSFETHGAGEMGLSIRLVLPPGSPLMCDTNTWPRHMPMGGERRPVLAQQVAQAPRGWTCPAPAQAALKALDAQSRPTVRMILASSGAFQHGWRPSWLGQDLTGIPPIPEAPRLRLLAASVGRWQAVSGWSYVNRGPKRTTRLVPAGACYVFEVMEGQPSALANGWLQPVDEAGASELTGSPNDNDTLLGSGCGLALWGPCP